MKEFTKEDLDYYLDNFEIMDRAWMVMCLLDAALVDNSGLTKTMQKKINRAYGLLFDVYQEAGSNLP